MIIDTQSPAAPDWRDLYRLCISFINPRPIALVSTVDAAGVANLAPFSFYNMVCARPPLVMFCPGTFRDGREKDSYENIRGVPEFVVATVDRPIARKMVACAAELPRGQSEFDFSGLTRTAAQRVRPPLVAEAPVNIECTLHQIVDLGDGPGRGHIVIGRIEVIHVRDGLLTPSGVIDPHRLQTVGRLGGQFYCDVLDPYEMQIPEPPTRRDG